MDLTDTHRAKPTLLSILHAPMLDHLSDYLDIASTIALARTCRSLSHFYAEMRPRKWNVDRHLRQFVASPLRFREQVGIAEAIIAGEFAQGFFETVRAVGVSDGGEGKGGMMTLDLVVMPDGAGRLAGYLEGVENYEVEKVIFGFDELPYRHVESGISMTRTTTTTPRHSKPSTSTTRIRILSISSFSFPLRAILDGSWNTASVCLMSYRRAYCLFPHLTYLDRTSFMLSPPSPCYFKQAQNLLAQGYRFETSTSAHLHSGRGESGHSLQRCRKLGDRFCWKIDFAPLLGGGGEGLERLDPVRGEDVIEISENRAVMDEECVQRVRAAGLWDEERSRGAGYLHHYDAKLMRWSKIFC